MMRKTLGNALVIVLALTGLAACSADVGSGSDTLRAVDEAAMTSQLLYMTPEASPFPMTAAELSATGADPSVAIPVRVEIFDDIAAAWFAPGGVARVNRDGLVAVWRVEQRTPTAGELEGSGAEVGVVEPSDVRIYLDEPTQWVSEETAEVPHETVRQTILDFFDILIGEEEVATLARLGEYHPGCL